MEKSFRISAVIWKSFRMCDWSWTDALLPGYRPSANPFFTAIVTLEPQGSRTRYTAMAIHRDEAGRKRHEEMGFRDGWGKALDQLVAHAKTM